MTYLAHIVLNVSSVLCSSLRMSSIAFLTLFVHLQAQLYVVVSMLQQTWLNLQ